MLRFSGVNYSMLNTATSYIPPMMTVPNKEIKGVSLFDLVGGLSYAMDLISPQVVDHHTRVSSIAARLGLALHLSPKAMAELTLACLTHDIGAFSLHVRLDTLEFETTQIDHAETGWRLLRSFSGFERIAAIIRYHHHHFHDAVDATPDIVQLAQIINLADRLDVRLRSTNNPVSLVDAYKDIKKFAGTWFNPVHIEALDDICHGHDFIKDLNAKKEMAFLKNIATPLDMNLDMGGTLRFSQLFSQIIDFRSRFTATHSRGVASTARAMLRLYHSDVSKWDTMSVAGNLHDIGKLAVPQAILEKPGPLNDAEFTRMRSHATYTARVLNNIPGLETVAAWASNHHERMDGGGYPRGVGRQSLDMGSRILAVADVFTALTEDRPYRAGMNRADSLKILLSMAKEGALDKEAVSLLANNYDEMNAVRINSQNQALADFQDFSQVQ